MKQIILVLALAVIVGCGSVPTHDEAPSAPAQEPTVQVVEPSVQDVWVITLHGVETYTGLVTLYYDNEPVTQVVDNGVLQLEVVEQGSPVEAIAATEEAPATLRVCMQNGESVVTQMPGFLGRLNTQAQCFTLRTGDNTWVATIIRTKRWLPTRPEIVEVREDSVSTLIQLEQLEEQLPLYLALQQIADADVSAIESSLSRVTRYHDQLSATLNEHQECLDRCLELEQIIAEEPTEVQRLRDEVTAIGVHIADLYDSLEGEEDEAVVASINEQIDEETLLLANRDDDRRAVDQRIEEAQAELDILAENRPTEDQLVAERRELRMVESFKEELNAEHERLNAVLRTARSKYANAFRRHTQLTKQYNRERREARESELISESDAVGNSSLEGSTVPESTSSTTRPTGSRYIANFFDHVRMGWEGEVDLYQGITPVVHFRCRIEDRMPQLAETTEGVASTASLALEESNAWMVVIEPSGSCMFPDWWQDYLDANKSNLPLRLRERGGERRWIMRIIQLRD